MQRATNTKNPSEVLWRVRLGSALRTILACSIVGCTTLYGPASLQRLIAYPAFSYVTTVLIVSDATLGDTLRGFWHAVYATIQVMILSTLSFWLVGPSKFNKSIAAAAVALTAFVVALPESTHLMSKRIAFGQIVIVYVGIVIQGAEIGVIRHLSQVASSAALGALSSVLAMFFPYPRLAYNEVRRTSQLYAENASMRLGHLTDAFSARETSTARDFVFKAKSLSEAGAAFLESIQKNLGGMLWERRGMPFLRANCKEVGEQLQEMEIPIRGMEIAVTSCQSFPVSIVDEEELRYVLRSLTEQIGKLEQANSSVTFGSTIAPERTINFSEKFNQNLKTILITPENLPASFFFYCMGLLSDLLSFMGTDSQKTNTEESAHAEKQAKCVFHKTWSLSKLLPSSKNLVFAFKCSISLGLAVLLGLIYNKENGYWSGLAIAISFVTGGYATFAVANARVQGTAMGSIFGILCCFIFKDLLFRFLSLIPWIIFTSFLRHSRMYGQAGGISAVIGALLILGRKNYGPPGEFAIARIVEASIGLLCLLIVELLVLPVRAATLVKTNLSRSLGTLQECFKDMVLHAKQDSSPSIFPALREKHKRLRAQINELKMLIADAELEPNFWFSSFPGDSYNKLRGSLSKMVELLLFANYTTEILSQASSRLGIALEELQGHIEDLELFKEEVGSTMKCLQEVTSIKSLAMLEKELQKKNTSRDIELGKSSNANTFGVSIADEEKIENIVSSFLLHSRKLADKVYTNEVEDKLKSEMVLCLCGLVFSINTLMRETMRIREEVKELVNWGNPSSYVNSREIPCKINTMHTEQI